MINNVEVPLTDNQEIALNSLISAIGVEAFESSELFTQLNLGNYEVAAKEFLSFPQEGPLWSRSNDYRIFCGI